ncbi:ThiF family adenylyltransferase [Aneurinibacillus sp. Ricciae_BoGa-3]|uniref:ThiF family adenylyltransferase n=1 Tax=Aneurinibacillus sp. Ricciae_BoGa-3 TaxID=3022697 RepID=UPI0023410058|nr:ThiF family adenylyltransferase [Aneurinibacillus sp. Ricciae_BoGa-3]WCK55731.1 ThiF family adenylyltransferase [Aneurinibacillus sp. Ricciae_BoGa-3]
MDTRYSRQILFKPIGQEGQERLGASRAVIVGAGALGTVLANHMVRAGVGHVRVIDRDFVEPSNLQRQMLYDEEDAAQHLPKAAAAYEKLRKINSGVTIEPVITDVIPSNAESLLADADIILDGTDNFQIRYLINDVAVKHRIPWVYGGAVSSQGIFAAFRPGQTPCLRCLYPDFPEGGETCDTAGVIGPVVDIVASYQAVEALKLLLHDEEHYSPFLENLEVWNNTHNQTRIAKGRNPECPACGRGLYEFLEHTGEQEQVAALCGRNSVQITPAFDRQLNLDQLAETFAVLGKVERNKFLLRFKTGDYTLVVFPNGRTMVQGTGDPAVARTLYARFIGA